MYSQLESPANNLKTKSTPGDLKQRLDWGEPALTIIDARERAAFNISHITGAISLPEAELVERVGKNLEITRDIYLYNSTDEKTSQTATLLREAGYQNVLEITGGLAAWKALGYPIEGNSAIIA